MPEWKISIVDYGTKPADQFLAHPQNYRRHPQAQRDALKGSLNRVGWIAPVLENKRTGHVLDGHERVWSALQNDNAEVPYIVVDVPEEDEAFVLATFDPITAMAQIDAEVLDEVLRQVQTDDEALQTMLADMAAEAEMYGGEFERPAFDSLIEELGEQSQGIPEKNERWFYVEYYQDEARWSELQRLLQGKMVGDSLHEVSADFFYAVLREACNDGATM